HERHPYPATSSRLRHDGRGRTRAQLERRLLAQHCSLELTQRLARLDPQLVDEELARATEELERVGLPPGPVKREHQQLARPFAQRLRCDESFEVRDHG